MSEWSDPWSNTIDWFDWPGRLFIMIASPFITSFPHYYAPRCFSHIWLWLYISHSFIVKIKYYWIYGDKLHLMWFSYYLILLYIKCWLVMYYNQWKCLEKINNNTVLVSTMFTTRMCVRLDDTTSLMNDISS